VFHQRRLKMHKWVLEVYSTSHIPQVCDLNGQYIQSEVTTILNKLPHFNAVAFIKQYPLKCF
jgi:hypothetical protein